LCGFELYLNMLMGYNNVFLISGGATKVDVETIAKVGNEYQGGYQGILLLGSIRWLAWWSSI
jgi:hypothetical protein